MKLFGHTEQRTKHPLEPPRTKWYSEKLTVGGIRTSSLLGDQGLLSVELEHQAYWAIKKLNLNPELAGQKRLDQLHDLEEFRLHAYENAKLYKEKTKHWHDKHIITRIFEPGQKVLLFNSRLKLFPRKLQSKWSGPFEVVQVTSNEAVELWNTTKTSTFLVNGQKVKHYFGKDVNHEEETIELENE
ncbi:uncharacterized protein LOC129892834 [Solanum dulcamara]|uniref:uncharacterized protein LOC129892834 n=1 Tax=Solanum dulcamara TaxID=45834 RepID=UPI002486A6A9|nr:uncharacterized protein LOC129892834 [Solanum dulcamara]